MTAKEWLEANEFNPARIEAAMEAYAKHCIAELFADQGLTLGKVRAAMHPRRFSELTAYETCKALRKRAGLE